MRTPHTWKSTRGSTYMGGSETENKNEVYMAFWGKDEVRQSGAREGYFRMIRKAKVQYWVVCLALYVGHKYIYIFLVMTH